MGFMHATPGDMKSFRSSAERMALMLRCSGGGGGEGRIAVRLEKQRRKRTRGLKRHLMQKQDPYNKRKKKEFTKIQKSKNPPPMSRRKALCRHGLSIGLHFQTFLTNHLRGLSPHCNSAATAHVIAHLGRIRVSCPATFLPSAN